MQDTPPENPDALPSDVEKGDDFHPPRCVLLGEEIETFPGEFDEARGGGFDGQGGGQYLIGRRLGGNEEFAEEAAFGQ